jgi:hypothetical protein
MGLNLDSSLLPFDTIAPFFPSIQSLPSIQLLTQSLRELGVLPFDTIADAITQGTWCTPGNLGDGTNGG